MKKKKILLTCIFSAVCILWLYPILQVAINSLKTNDAINQAVFDLPAADTFAGIGNYIKGLTFGNYPFLRSAFLPFTSSVTPSLLGRKNAPKHPLPKNKKRKRAKKKLLLFRKSLSIILSSANSAAVNLNIASRKKSVSNKRNF